MKVPYIWVLFFYVLYFALYWHNISEILLHMFAISFKLASSYIQLFAFSFIKLHRK